MVLLLLKYEFFLGSKKRNLSDKSRNSEDGKKDRESSDIARSLPDDVFSGGFNSPKCARLLIV